MWHSQGPYGLHEPGRVGPYSVQWPQKVLPGLVVRLGALWR